MKKTSSTLEGFALRSYVSVLPETEKETALKISGGYVPPNICKDPDDNIMGPEEWNQHKEEYPNTFPCYSV